MTFTTCPIRKLCLINDQSIYSSYIQTVVKVSQRPTFCSFFFWTLIMAKLINSVNSCFCRVVIHYLQRFFCCLIYFFVTMHCSKQGHGFVFLETYDTRACLFLNANKLDPTSQFFPVANCLGISSLFFLSLPSRVICFSKRSSESLVLVNQLSVATLIPKLCTGLQRVLTTCSTSPTLFCIPFASCVGQAIVSITRSSVTHKK